MQTAEFGKFVHQANLFLSRSSIQNCDFGKSLHQTFLFRSTQTCEDGYWLHYASLELAVLFVVGACVLEQPTSTNNDRINEGKNIFLIINFMFTFNDFTK